MKNPKALKAVRAVEYEARKCSDCGGLIELQSVSTSGCSLTCKCSHWISGYHSLSGRPMLETIEFASRKGEKK